MKQKILELTKGLTSIELKEIIKEAIKETTNTIEKATLTIDECVKYSGIGRDKIMQLAHGENNFPAFKVGTKFLVNKELLDNWLESISKEKKVI
ncbi:excisionase [Clostridium botulinum]|uniref:excisionase n=1 Tax=Clostridium botulinum TaxID=1491 RepID=UPI000159213D|nr:excisionase [Clostridium botulinum]ABS34629.1 DNA binding protein, excisionase family [Clostridium botulinum A str. ATCC 19397]APH23333.1 DNA binding, excisionase family domain protein [Clostridium botulinum]APQ68273.1 DNA binding, excisionase family domain protein [Clostridium botulinum]KOM97102.1 excisionase [Clostridium botulinum]KOM99519.1 excisionase [Clostridium botulinum]